MAREPYRWTLADLINLEAGLVRGGDVSAEARAVVAEAVKGSHGADARSRGLRAWLAHTRAGAGGKASPGARFVAALGLTGLLGALVFAVAGAGAVAGLVDGARGGIHVTLFLAVVIGTQWLVLAAAFAAWGLRHKTGAAFSGMQALLGAVARRLGGVRDSGWWQALADAGGHARAALLWRLARLAQTCGIAFNLGAMAGLGGIVLVRNTGFFWETTTSGAMRHILGRIVDVLSAPWARWWPGAVPDAAVIEATRLLPDHSGRLLPGPAQWWLFLLMAIAVWGLLPRVLLWLWCWRSGRRALAGLDFQSRAHRALWRSLSVPGRSDVDAKPDDGALVLDVGGTGIAPAALRPFLLQRLRVNPAAWETMAVLDPGAELAAARALAQAPAGVVLLAEGWSLSPPRMAALHSQIRAITGPDREIRFLVANAGLGAQPVPPSGDERREWERFVDSLRDPCAEVVAFDEENRAKSPA